ncbi:hypothetical protein THAOC_07364 [Thalassiosira oceanica]|uniref:Uncharacterized protein n=1 Tax=Thalassiosira oceanica TaxID=159749 RepID=K0SXT3_THAOC|nr:hypothetical protein THAOC_07364 [Thalassiosira oceanica]|eukprot:EJK71218.1 hypothetical protein THAOC_07364 [Thalassiosira oceanica]
MADDAPEDSKIDGDIAKASRPTFASLEESARRAEAKGVYFNRGPHPFAKVIESWLEDKDEDDYEFGELAVAQVQVAPEADDRADDAGSPPVNTNMTDDAGSPPVNTNMTDDITDAVLEDIKEACAHLTSVLPHSFRSAVADDAIALASMCTSLNPKVPWLTFRLEIVQNNACVRWHQDVYCGRCIITYVGPGTCAASDRDVDWDSIAKEGDNTDCVLGDKTEQMSTNAVLLMKGSGWPGIRGEGLTHRAPNCCENGTECGDGSSNPKRLILVSRSGCTTPLSPVPTDEGEEARRSGSYVHVISTYVPPILIPPHSQVNCSRNCATAQTREDKEKHRM